MRKRREEKEIPIGRKTDTLWNFIQANVPKGEIEGLRARLQELKNNVRASHKESKDAIAKLIANFIELKKNQSKLENNISNISASDKLLKLSAEKRVLHLIDYGIVLRKRTFITGRHVIGIMLRNIRKYVLLAEASNRRVIKSKLFTL